ncbi:hypothetical protein ACIGXM_19485 [Kitasatospora sp. NPDC052896]|uniref:hypothetical protein n=1 Tax=Kitasatospora sp. NPDC052896 TaxID=3364061 RepID=UPI0037C6190D
MQNADVPPQDRSAGPAGHPGPDLREELLRYVELGGTTLVAETHAWYAAAGSVTGPEEARAASTALAEIRGGDLAGAREAATRLATVAALREPGTATEVNALVALVRRVQDTAATLRVDAYQADLDALAAATATSNWRRERGIKLSWGRRRRLRAEARRLAAADRPRREVLHEALVAALAERSEWALWATGAAGTAPGVRALDGELVDAAAQAAEALAAGLRKLDRLLPEGDLTMLPFDDLADLVDRLAADEGTLYRLPELRTLREGLEAGGLGELLAGLTAGRADRSAAEAAYRRHTGEAEAAARSALAAGPRESREDVVAEPEAEGAAAVEVAPVEAAPVEVEPAAVEVAPVEPVEEEVEPAAVEPAAAEVEPAAVEPVEEEAEAVETAEPVVVEAVEPAEPAAVAELEDGEDAAADAVVAEPAESVIAEAVVVAEPVVAEEPEPEPESVEPVVVEVAVSVTAEAEAVAVEVEPAPVAEVEPAPVKRVRRPRKPEVVAGRPVTAYTPEQLVALVRWIDGDTVERTDDELLRAAMKELGFARLGPRIKEALGAAVAAVRPGAGDLEG